MNLDLSRCRRSPWAHQVQGITELVKWNDPARGRIAGGCFFLADEMRLGKTFQTIAAAQVLYERDLIDRVLVICPNNVRSVWYDPDLGELNKFLWDGLPAVVTEYHQRQRRWGWSLPENGKVDRALWWVITNYEFVRVKLRLEKIVPFASKRTLLILDESSAVSSANARQTRACWKLRKKCGWVWLLNGTPVGDRPIDLYAQGKMLSPEVHGCNTKVEFTSQFCYVGGWENKQITGYHDLEALRERMAPYVLRRLKADCLDLPPKLPPVTLTVRLTDATWAAYKQMRDELVLWLKQQGSNTIAVQAGVKVMRLAQICNGFVGGVKPLDAEDAAPATVVADDAPTWLSKYRKPDRSGEPVTRQGNIRLPVDYDAVRRDEVLYGAPGVTSIGREKTEGVLDWVRTTLAQDREAKIIVWCRFRVQVSALMHEFRKIEGLKTGVMWGNQKTEERDAVKRLLHPDTSPRGPIVVTGIPSSGARGLNFAAATYALYASNDYSLETRQQSEDRCHGPESTSAVWYGDVIAEGPRSQKTIEHTVLKALHDKRRLADWTCEAWIRAVTEE